MRMSSRLIATAACAALWVTSVARADELPAFDLTPPPVVPETPGPKVAWGLVAGTLTAMVPLAIGSGIYAASASDNHRKIASSTIAYGMTLAPIVSHLVVHEWKRAIFFGIVPLACAVSVTALLEIQPSATSYGTRGGRWAYGLLMSVNVFSAGLGIIDTLGARSRYDDRAQAERRIARIPVLPAPIVTQGGGGLAAVGNF
jgi:hypothetical protein